MPVVLVRTKEPEPFLLSAVAPQGIAMRAALVRIAGSYAVGIHFPTTNELAEWAVDTVGSPNPVIATTEPERMIVDGTLSFNVKEFGWTGSWTVGLAGIEHHWEVHGVAFDQAFEAVVGGVVELSAGTGTP